MNNLYINLASLLNLLEELDSIPDTWYYYAMLEEVLNELESGRGIPTEGCVDIVVSSFQTIVRHNGNVHKARQLVDELLSILHEISANV